MKQSSHDKSMLHLDHAASTGPACSATVPWLLLDVRQQLLTRRTQGELLCVIRDADRIHLVRIVGGSTRNLRIRQRLVDPRPDLVGPHQAVRLETLGAEVDPLAVEITVVA